MTARSHDLAAFTALHGFLYLATLPSQISLLTLVTSVSANYLGALLPDIDNASASFWRQIRGGKIISHILSPLLGGHRLISHSLIGIYLSYLLLTKLLLLFNHAFIVDHSIVISSFIIGYSSHLFTDSLTKRGIPLFFPLTFSVAIPPIKKLRFKTGGWAEKTIFFPFLILLNFYLVKNFGYLLPPILDRLVK